MSSDFQSALIFTLKQALLSSAFSVVIALIAAPGYFKLGVIKRFIRSLLLFPQLVSPVLVVLSLLLFFNSFPFGLTGVVLGHVFINAGLGIILLGEAWEVIERDLEKLSSFLGASRGFYIRKVMLPMIWPQIKAYFSLVFGFSLASLLVPLVLGGGPQASTLEVLIYEKIKIGGEYKSAVLIALVQFLLQFLFFFVFLKTLKVKMMKTKNIFEYYKFDLSALVTLVISLLLFFPFVKIIEVALSKPFVQNNSLFYQALGNSLFVATGVAVLSLALVALWNVGGSKTLISKFPSVSHVLLGLAGIVVFGVSGAESRMIMFVALIAGHLVASIFALLRFAGEPLNQLYQKFSPALKNLGASKWVALKAVYFVEGKRIYFFVILAAFCWSLGEFTVSSLLAPSQATLPLYVQSFMGQYRLEEAAQASLVLFIVGFIASVAGESFLNERT